MKHSLCLASIVLATVSLTRVGNAAEPAGPVTIVSHVDILPDVYRPQSEEQAQALLRAEVAAAKHDRGFVSYQVLRQTDAPNHFTVVETWQDMAAYAAHFGSAHTVSFRTKIQPLLGSPFDARIHQPLP